MMNELYERNFNNLIDRYLTEGKMDSECYAQLTSSQKDVVQCIKRSLLRLGRR